MWWINFPFIVLFKKKKLLMAVEQIHVRFITKCNFRENTGDKKKQMVKGCKTKHMAKPFLVFCDSNDKSFERHLLQ